jgi:histidine triad (HIT) family protein
MADECIFCRIAAGKAPASVIYRDALVCVFMDAHPVTPGHALVVPVAHATHLADMPEETGEHLFLVAQRIAAAIRASGLKSEGIALFLADGAAATQEIMHVHLHVVPRFAGDGIGPRFCGRGSFRPSRMELEETAELIRARLNG